MTTAAPGARARARAEITAELLAVARRHLATEGAAGLSLRAIARELGMVSSGIYRYVGSRDELLTLLIIEAYDALGEAAERAAARSRTKPPAERLVAVARAIRRWAVAHPHQYALLYGTPVPDYEAPQDTIASAARVTRALVGVVADAHADGRLDDPPGPRADLSAGLQRDIDAAQSALESALPDEVVVRMLSAWTQMFGLVSFELFGQTQNVIHDHAALLDATVASTAASIGLHRT